MRSPSKEACLKRLNKELLTLSAIMRQEIMTPESVATMVHITSLISLIKTSHVLKLDMNIRTMKSGKK